MKFEDQNVDTSGVDDLRSRRGVPGGMPVLAGGGGIVGLIVAILVVVLNSSGGLPGGAIDPSLIGQDVVGGPAGAGASELADRCSAEGAVGTYDDCYLVKVFNETDEVWQETFTAAGRGGFQGPRLTFFRDAVRTGCGTASSEVGPFYCPADRRIYLDLDFLTELQNRFGAEGRYAQAYILAHEYGHHLQTVLGTEAQVRRAQQRSPDQANELSVRMELQADCLAGVWGGRANDAGNVTVTEAEVAQAQRAAAAVGDDRIQSRTTGRVDPESWTHGSAADRQRWFTTGFTARDLEACDTFSS